MVLEELTRLIGVSGAEGPVRDYIMEKARPLCDQMWVDRMGNLLCRVEGRDPQAGLALVLAHMDEVGLMVQGINDDGLISYQCVGGIDPRVLVSKRVRVGEKGIPGVIGAKAIHLQSREERQKPLTHKELYVDIGCKDKESAQKLVNPGDIMGFEPGWTAYGQGFVMSKALDDRVGCYNMLRLMEERYPVSVVYAFTVQEEVGLRGAQVVAQQFSPRCALVLEGTTANDLGCVPAHQQVCRAGAGVAISFMDRTSIAHPALARALRRTAQRCAIPWQFKTFVSGGNDAGQVQNAKGAVAVCPLSVPCRYIHSPSSACNLADVEAQYDLAHRFLLDGAPFEEEG